MPMRSRTTLLIVLAIAVSIALCTAGCEKKPARKPVLKWVNLLNYAMDDWNMKGKNAAFTACSDPPREADQFQACLREKVPEELRTRSWSIPLHAGPSKQSKQIGEIRITGKVLAGFTMEYIAGNGAAVAFRPDNSLEYADSEAHQHTVLEEREGWVLLPKRPFPTEVWMEAGQQHAVADVGDDVYRWGEKSIVILEVTETGVVARQEIPADMPCDEAEPTPEGQIRKFSIPWKELFDENGHLRLIQKYTMC